jgi:hypothetical protein
MKKIKSLEQAKTLSLKPPHDSVEHSASLSIEVEGKSWKCYTVAVGYREFTCYCDEGVASYVVDTYGDRSTCELIDWEVDA